MADAPDQIAVAYAVTVDGFISISHKHIHNPDSPFIIWMPEEVWQKLATCATTQGLFYIPATSTMTDYGTLYSLVQKEPQA
jgi:hypothetical protein